MFAIYAYTEDVSWTNIYHYDKDARTLNYETSPQIKDLVQDWYNPPIAWAERIRVMDGYGAHIPARRQHHAPGVRPNALYYAKHKGYDLTAAGDLSTFPHSGSVADWAEAAMSWANGNELINGHDDGTIDAGGTAIRAQTASILMRFDQNLVKN